MAPKRKRSLPPADTGAKKHKRKAGKPQQAVYLQEVAEAHAALEPDSKECVAAYAGFAAAAVLALGKEGALTLLQSMSKPMPGATPEYLTDRGQRDEELPGTNFEPHPGRGLVAECPVRIVLLKSWQRHINAQYVLQQFPALFPSFEAAYRRIYGPGVQVPPQGDFFWNFNGDHEKPQWSVCATATVQTQAARDLCDDPTASYGSIPCINSCVKYDTAQTQSYELPPTSDLERSYKMLPSDWAVDAKHGRLLGTVYLIESAIQCGVIVDLLNDPSGPLITKWDLLSAYDALTTAVEGVAPPPGLCSSFARVVELRKHEGTPFIIVSALSIATLVKGPFVAPMQRAVALRSYYHSMRIRMVLIDSLLPLLAGGDASTLQLPVYEKSHLSHAFDQIAFSAEELHLIAAPDPAEVERLRQICQRGGWAIDALWRELAAQLGFARRPFAAPAGAFGRSWELLALIAQLEHQQRQLKYAAQQQAQRIERQGRRELRASKDAQQPRVLLVRRASAGLISTQLRVSQGELEALSEEIRLFDAAVRKKASAADENPERAKQRRGDGAKPRTKATLHRVGDWERVVEVGLADREKNHARAAASHTSLSGLI